MLKTMSITKTLVGGAYDDQNPDGWINWKKLRETGRVTEKEAILSNGDKVKTLSYLSESGDVIVRQRFYDKVVSKSLAEQVEELHGLLHFAVTDEDYVEAAYLRDKINLLKSKQDE